MSDYDATADGTMTVTEAMRFTGLGRSHLYVMMDRGELKFAKLGKRRLILRSSLRQAIRDGLFGAK